MVHNSISITIAPLLEGRCLYHSHLGKTKARHLGTQARGIWVASPGSKLYHKWRDESNFAFLQPDSQLW